MNIMIDTISYIILHNVNMILYEMRQINIATAACFYFHALCASYSHHKTYLVGTRYAHEVGTYLNVPGTKICRNRMFSPT